MTKKCRSKSRNPNGGGCGDPQCPEGQQEIDSRIVTAINNSDLNSYIAAKEAQEPTPPVLKRPAGLPTAAIEAALGTMLPVSTRPKGLPTSPWGNSTSPKAFAASVNKNNLPSYSDVKSMEEGLNKLYEHNGIAYGFVELAFVEQGDLKIIEVEDMQVDKQVRGMGVGRHMRATIMQFADKNNCVVAGIPTSAGDGTVPKTSEEYPANQLSHRKRLEKYYLDSGYEYNHAFYLNTDPLTHEEIEKDPEWVKQFNEEAIGFLRTSGQYVKWPNNTIPANWRA